MSEISFRDRLERLPLILAGPILHHTSSESVTVWVALKEPRWVAIEVYETAESGNVVGALVIAGERTTIALGRYLHIVAVTAKSHNGDSLRSGQLYAYDLSFTRTEGDRQTLKQALTSSSLPLVPISYFPHQLPTFALPPEDLERLQIVYGSCRKPHGKGYDALPILDSLLEHNAALPDFRPHQLFLTGDRIYGDDVADLLLYALTEVGDLLLGWQEQLPLLPSSKVSHLTPKQLKPGQRSKIACEQAGFTAGIRDKAEFAKSHLFGLGEYYAIYLFAWSQVFWLEPFPKGREIYQDRQAAKQWDRELKDLQQFASTIWKVRRALANVPRYTIFDDHDVSDDWYLNQAWCLRVLGKPLGRRVVQNALLAYAVFQGWGNTPEQFQDGQLGAKLLEAASEWSASAGGDKKAEEAIARYLGLPESNPLTGLPKMRLDGQFLILDRSPEALRWHYTVRGDGHEVIVLDTRTRRGYPADRDPIAPPALLCPSVFERQLRAVLQQVRSNIKATLAISPTNLFTLQAIDRIQQWHLKQGKVYHADVGDGWNMNASGLAAFLATLFEERDRVIILSGDIHYSATARLDYWSRRPSDSVVSESEQSFKPHLLTQFTSSALKNSELMTQLIHTKAKSILMPERRRFWIGWTNPPEMIEVRHTDRSLPEWKCSLEWIPRQPIQIPEWGKTVPWLRVQQKQNWLCNSVKWLWRNRWFQEGKEVVGTNNLGLIQFERSDNEGAAIQDIYWYTSWGNTRVGFSRFQASLHLRQLPNKIKSGGL
ncbi:PhoD-like phosphatase [Pleurocapsa sp. PCC 7327]|uniref:PhoD-like phosphatase n=1 Tax=Pleurocapsa sp. PCC 7327 TaxID=118163 RepID=UPI00029FB113|nr:PhoD-like phosphatase [Pleurocapsa sp. PCC 7327]AFY77727.1 PhoD-like phosphatase [Pleurocapsa sp. PCC 7327]